MSTKWKHRPCPCGCNELADECMRPSSALNAFRITDEPPVEPDTAWVDDEPELSQWANEMGYDFTPGQWPSPIAGF